MNTIHHTAPEFNPIGFSLNRLEVQLRRMQQTLRSYRCEPHTAGCFERVQRLKTRLSNSFRQVQVLKEQSLGPGTPELVRLQKEVTLLDSDLKNYMREVQLSGA